jgi:pantoate kinase
MATLTGTPPLPSLARLSLSALDVGTLIDQDAAPKLKDAARKLKNALEELEELSRMSNQFPEDTGLHKLIKEQLDKIKKLEKDVDEMAGTLIDQDAAPKLKDAARKLKNALKELEELSRMSNEFPEDTGLHKLIKEQLDKIKKLAKDVGEMDGR